MALLVRAALPWSWRDRGQQRVVTGGLRAAAAPCSTWLRANSQNLASCREIVTLEEVRGLGFRVSNLRRRRRRVVVGVARSSMNLGPSPGGGGGGEENGIGRVVVNLTIAGGLTYLTITGKLGWLFDAFVSLWLFVVLVPIVGFIAFLWFADREIISSTCPNCGNPFQVLEFTMKEEEEQFCPYCSQPFKLEGKQFVRDGPRFSKKQSKGFRPPFGGGSVGGSRQRQTSGPTSPSDSPGVIVDVEAEVLDQE